MDLQALQDRAATVRDRVPISTIIGADVRLRKAGRELTGLCPFHGDRRDGAFMVNDDKGIFKCFACGKSGDVLDYIQDRKGVSFLDALKELEADAGIDFTSAKAKAEAAERRAARAQEAVEDEERRRRNAEGLWLSSAPGEASPAQRYLEARGIDFARLARFPGAIRFRPDLLNGETNRKLPGMVTAIHDAAGKFLAVHRTWLAFDGRGWGKAKLDKPKMVLGNFYGGSITLAKGPSGKSLANMPAGTTIALSEGIEDGLSVAMAAPELHVRAAISLDNMGNVALPPQAGELVFLCQRDRDTRMRDAARARAAGDHEAAAHHDRVAVKIMEALERAIGKQQDRGRVVRAAWPAKGFKDFNDELRGARMELAA